MRSIQLKNKEYKQLETGFGQWLQILNYVKRTVVDSPLRIREFLHWLEQHKINQVTAITEETIKAYFHYLSHRKNHRRPGGLSADYLNIHLTCLKRFSRYLQQARECGFVVPLSVLPSGQRLLVLKKEEIKKLYAVTGSDVLGIRDRAMLSIYYGCGLRRTEGEQLDLVDVLWERSLLYVRKGKNSKERYVPMTRQVIADLQQYVTLARPRHDQGFSTALLISRRSNRLTGGSALERFKYLLTKAQIDKPATLHTLRHSIATHLLEGGMSLLYISRFLGHSSLQSTQIYTHILHSNKIYTDVNP